MMMLRTALLTTVLAWLSLCPAARVNAQDSLFPKAPPLPKPGAPTVDPNDPNIEIQKPLPFSEQERRVLSSANNLPVERLQELLAVYERLDNTPMIDAIVRAILKRDPKNAMALKARSALDPQEETRAVGFLESLAQKVMAGEKVDDVDSVGVHATNLLAEDRNEEALALLQALRKNQFDKQFFPYLDDLALALAETGRVDEAEAAYKEVAADQRFTVEIRQEAQQTLPTLATKRRMFDIKKNAGDNLDQLVAQSTKLLEEKPADFEVLAFHIECLDRAKRYNEAVDLLLKLKAKAPVGSAWPWQPTLAFAYYGAKRFDDAVAAFTEIKGNAQYDPAVKLEAESMILEIGVSRQIEEGILALNRADMPAAEATLRKLEASHPNHADTIGFKAIYLAKIGKSDEALALLAQKKREMEAQGLPFSQADSMADVYVTRKEFSNARATILAVINDPRYDDEERSTARIQLANIEIAEKLEDGYVALRDSKRKQAKAILEEARKINPDSPDVAIFSAEVDLAYGKPKEALEQLSVQKAKSAPGLPFAGQNSYAGALAQTGDWQAGYDAYGETLSQFGYTPIDQFEARWMRRALVPYLRPHVKTENRYVTEEEGSLFSTDWEYLSAWEGQWRYGAFARADVSKVKGSSYFSGLDGTRAEGGALVQRLFERGYFAEATAGMNGEGFMYSARFGQMAFQRMNWSIGWEGNARSTDSVALQALDGRENRISANFSGPITERLIVSAQAYYNWAEIGGEELGDGIGLELGADYILQTETPTRPELTVSYFGEYRKFNHASSIPTAAQKEVRRAVLPEDEQKGGIVTGDTTRDIFNTLADPETNRHGSLFKISKHFGDNIEAYAQVGAYYAFDDESLEFLGALGAEYWITDHSMIYTELRYDTSGRGQSTGAGVFEANLGGSISF